MTGTTTTAAAEATVEVPWRSMLYVPVNVERFVRKAAGVGADAIQLDLEDSILPGEKDAARGALPAAVETLTAAGCDVVVRVNRPLRMLVRDLEVAVRPGVRAIAVPKVASADHLRLVDETITELELERDLAPGGIRVIAMVETTGAMLQVGEIAAATTRTAALTLGTEDFALSAGIRPDPDLMLGAKQQVIFAARAAGVWPLGLVGSVAGYRDLDEFRRIARLSRRVGCLGASAIHPTQVPVLNEEFTPRAEDVDQARTLLATYEEAAGRGLGAISFEGTMVDEPVARRARELVATADALAARDTRGSGESGGA